MQETLDKLDNLTLEGIVKRLKNANEDLNSLISNFKGEILADRIENRRSRFETTTKWAEDAISDFEDFVSEHRETKFDKKIIRDFDYQHEICRLRQELLTEIFAEAYRKSFQIIK